MAIISVLAGYYYTSSNMCVTSGNADEIRHVLPVNVQPKHYNLTLTPDLVNFTFEGSVDIKYGID